MMENVEQMECGGCGGKEYAVYLHIPTKRVILECKQCKSANIVQHTVTTSLEWVNDDQLGSITSNHWHK